MSWNVISKTQESIGFFSWILICHSDAFAIDLLSQFEVYTHQFQAGNDLHVDSVFLGLLLIGFVCWVWNADVNYAISVFVENAVLGYFELECLM